MPCPHCQGTDCRYSHRRSWERLVPRVLPWRPFRCRGCRRRFWARAQAGPTSGFGIRQHLSWLLPLALVFTISALYIHNLPYERAEARRPGKGATAGVSSMGAGPADNDRSGRRLHRLELTEVAGGLRLTIFGAGPLKPSALRHLQVPDRIVLDLPGPWIPPAPSTRDLVHPLLDRVRLVEQGRDLRLELLLREAKVEATVEETEDGLVITLAGHHSSENRATPHGI